MSLGRMAKYYYIQEKGEERQDNEEWMRTQQQQQRAAHTQTDLQKRDKRDTSVARGAGIQREEKRSVEGREPRNQLN